MLESIAGIVGVSLCGIFVLGMCVLTIIGGIVGGIILLALGIIALPIFIILLVLEWLVNKVRGT